MTQEAPENGGNRQAYQDRRRGLYERLREAEYRTPENRLNHDPILASINY